MTDFALTYEPVDTFLGTTFFCNGCEEVLETGELAAQIKMGRTSIRLHRECADQLAVLLRQFIIATIQEEEGRVN